MQLVVCLKHVPDPGEPVRYLEGSRALSREDVQGVVGPLDDQALEVALSLRECLADAQVIALCMGPPSARDSMRRVQAKGVDRAILVCDPALAGSDLPVTARVLAAALGRLEDVTLVLCGATSADAGSGVLGAMLAATLGWPLLAHAHSVTVDPATRTVDAVLETEIATTRRGAAWPAVITCGPAATDPRLPSFSGIMAATRQELETWTLADLGLAPDQVGPAGSTTLVVGVEERLRPLPPPGAREDLGALAQWLSDVLAEAAP